jgi:hypothetical protein
MESAGCSEHTDDAPRQPEYHSVFDHQRQDKTTRPIREWARLRGIHVETIRGRLRLGWSQEDAVSPIKSGILTLEGKTMSVSDWAKE